MSIAKTAAEFGEPSYSSCPTCPCCHNDCFTTIDLEFDPVFIFLSYYVFTKEEKEAYILPLGERYRKGPLRLEIKYDERDGLQFFHFKRSPTRLYSNQLLRFALKHLEHPLVIMLPQSDDQVWTTAVCRELEILFEQEITSGKVFLSQES